MFCACDWSGDPVEEHDNPADHFLDVIIASEKTQDKKEEDSEKEVEKAEMHVRKSIDLVGHYATSREYKIVRSTIDPVLEELEAREKEAGMLGMRLRKARVSYATSFIWQVAPGGMSDEATL